MKTGRNEFLIPPNDKLAPRKCLVWAPGRIGNATIDDSSTKLANALLLLGPLKANVLGRSLSTTPPTGRCYARGRNHRVILVGYNRTAEVPYWIVQSSWGTDRGNDGFF